MKTFIRKVHPVYLYITTSSTPVTAIQMRNAYIGAAAVLTAKRSRRGKAPSPSAQLHINGKLAMEFIEPSHNCSSFIHLLREKFLSFTAQNKVKKTVIKEFSCDQAKRDLEPTPPPDRATILYAIAPRTPFYHT